MAPIRIVKALYKLFPLLLGMAVPSCQTRQPAPVEPIAQQPSVLEWPGVADKGPAWPQPRGSWKLLEDRFNKASRASLGTEVDPAAIQERIAAYNPRWQLRVEEIRWLSSSLVMAYVRAMEAGYYFVLEKQGQTWGITHRYLIWVA